MGELMSLREAIEHAKGRVDGSLCGLEHRQLMNWLMELETLRKERTHMVSLLKNRLLSLEYLEREIRGEARVLEKALEGNYFYGE